MSWVRHGALPINLFVQATATSANVAPVIAAPLLLPVLGLSPVGVGVYVTIVYLGAMLSGQLSGALVRRWGPIRTSQACLLLCVAGLLLVATMRVETVAFGAFMMGLGYGPLTPASSDMLARVALPEKFALVFSIRQTGVPLGTAIAALLMPIVLQTSGVPAALMQMAALCALALALAHSLRAAFDDGRDIASPLPTRWRAPRGRCISCFRTRFCARWRSARWCSRRCR